MSVRVSGTNSILASCNWREKRHDVQLAHGIAAGFPLPSSMFPTIFFNNLLLPVKAHSSGRFSVTS